MTSEGGRAPDWLGRAIGLGVFFLGIVMLVVVFFQTGGLPVPVIVSGQDGRETMNTGIKFGVEVARLFVCGLVASWIAGRGAQLYAAANVAISGETARER